MEQVSIRIGSVAFDRADYDSEHDVLYLHVGEPQDGEGEETPEGHVIRFAPGTKLVVGLTVMSPRFLLERDGQLTDAGRAVIERARQDGSWTLLDEVENLSVPDDLAAELAARPPARKKFDAFPRGIRPTVRRSC